MNLLKSLFAISTMTLLSRILGFTRDTVVAYIFGAGIMTDAFFIAFKLPNLLRRIFAEGALTQAFIPILIEYKNKKDNEATRLFIAYISGLLTLILTLITLLGIIIAPWIIIITAPGFINNPDKLAITSKLLRITCPYILLISLSSLSGAILNTWNRFSVPAFTPAFLNISIINFALFFTSYFHPPIIALAWAVIVGGILQLIYQLPYLKSIGMLVLPRINLYNSNVRKVIHNMIPAILGVSINQVSLIINTIFASFLISGSISWLYYADRLIELPCGVLGAAISTILLPSLAKSFSDGNYKEYSYLIDWGIRLCFLFVLPSMVALAILAKPLTVVLFQYGNFTSLDSSMTEKALIAYSIGLIGLIMVKVLVPAFYSQQNIKTPVKIALITFILTQLMNFVFIGPFKHIGLSLSISLGAYFNAGLLYWQLRKKGILKLQSGWSFFLIQLFIAIVVMIAILLIILHIMPSWELGNMGSRLLRLFMVCIIGAISYFLTLNLLGLRLKDFSNTNKYSS
ncbi:murein biosynthesis integral membrane protein MurJ [Pantoea sp. Mhis]|uniref:murein biosynthesis integral membrane protein MurJ n=1 Tax=Pantoea sp. Mhis TaxID=2576759 RepID=UPI00135B0CFF|nr:murein biosynthesis integral membrane protein MurJ [Pantoea sp. Mhis]MXP56302.1 murein biosynthesis integral membrane protein MurJ [Pantoea sp. Mhis]